MDKNLLAVYFRRDDLKTKLFTIFSSSFYNSTHSSAEALFVLLCPQRFLGRAGRRPGEREQRQREGNAGKGKERRELFPSYPARPPKPNIIKKFP